MPRAIASAQEYNELVQDEVHLPQGRKLVLTTHHVQLLSNGDAGKGFDSLRLNKIAGHSRARSAVPWGQIVAKIFFLVYGLVFMYNTSLGFWFRLPVIPDEPPRSENFVDALDNVVNALSNLAYLFGGGGLSLVLILCWFSQLGSIGQLESVTTLKITSSGGKAIEAEIARQSVIGICVNGEDTKFEAIGRFLKNIDRACQGYSIAKQSGVDPGYREAQRRARSPARLR